MAFTVTLVNQTASQIILEESRITIPASGSSSYRSWYEFVDSSDVRQAIVNGDILISDGSTTFTQAESLSIIDPPASPVDLDSVNVALSTWSTFATVFTGGAAVTWEPNLRFTPNSDFYSLSGTEVTFVRPGIYRVSVSITANMSSAGTASTAEHALQINTVTVDGGLMYTFHNDTATGRSIASRSFNLPVNEGDVFRVFSQRLAGTGGLSFIPNACTLDINFVRSSSRP